VNPNTVQHAFSDLEHEGIIISRGTQGRYVTEDQQTIEQCREELARQCVLGLLRDLNQLGIPTEQAITMMKEAEHEHFGM
jgi:GntR family transcriptional regulator